MIKRLTKKQESLIPIIRDKWIDIAINKPTPEIDVLTKNIRFLYEDNDLSFEDVEIKVCDLNEFIKELSNADFTVYPNVCSIICFTMRSIVNYRVNPIIYSTIDPNIRYAAHAIYPAINHIVNPAIYHAIDLATRPAAHSDVYYAIHFSIYYRVNDIALGDYFFESGILVNDKLKDRFYKYVDILQGLGSIYLTDKKAIILKKPKVVLDSQRQTRELIWNKKCSLYFIDGVKFKKKWYDKILKDKFKPEEIFAIDNQEHRRIAYKYMDKTKMKNLKNYKILDEIKDDGYGYKMKVISFKVKGIDKPLKYLDCFCPSTGREYFIGTDEDKCWEAKAKSFGFSSNELKFIKEF